LAAVVGQCAPDLIVIASTAPSADELLREQVWGGRPQRVLRPEDVPLSILSSGTGIDRLLASWICHDRSGGAVLVADCGTAFTVDAVDVEGNFHGGVIGAGLGLQQAALASACPHLDAPVEGSDPIPRDTAAAVYAGTCSALAAAIDGLADRFEARLGGTAGRFLSGGDAPRLAASLPRWQPRRYLVLDALSAWAAPRELDG
jgi:type III pantothenate kinase